MRVFVISEGDITAALKSVNMSDVDERLVRLILNDDGLVFFKQVLTKGLLIGRNITEHMDLPIEEVTGVVRTYNEKLAVYNTRDILSNICVMDMFELTVHTSTPMLKMFSHTEYFSFEESGVCRNWVYDHIYDTIHRADESGLLGYYVEPVDVGSAVEKLETILTTILRHIYTYVSSTMTRTDMMDNRIFYTVGIVDRRLVVFIL